MSITKIKPGYMRKIPAVVDQTNGKVISWYSWQEGSDRITYDAGPRVRDGHSMWKRCGHEYNRHASLGSASLTLIDGSRVRTCYPFYEYGFNPGSNPVTMPTTESVMAKFWDELDLNCHDSVLLYSGILQAVPLVGGAFKFVKIMNDVGRKLARGLRHQPFTTVVKTAISMDFIDRFVVSPTIDDARKFLDAHNYVLRVLDTMYQRSQVLPSAYSMDSTNEQLVTSGNETCSFNPGISNGIEIKGSYRTSYRKQKKMFVLANVAYNTSAADPVKLWATRLGMTRPLDSVWDLIPFSFIVDYFTRAGDFIAGLGDRLTDQDALRGTLQKVHGAWICETSEFRKEYDWTRYNRHWQGEIEFTPGKMSIASGSFERYPFNPFAVGAESPNGFFSFDLSTTQLRTIAQLIIQAKL